MFVHILNDRGIARVLCRVSSMMARAGVDVSVVCIHNALGELDEVPVVTLGDASTGKLRAIKEFSDALSDGDYDVAFAHGEGPSRDLVLARMLAKSSTRIVVVSHIHRSTHPRRLPWVQDRIASLLLPRADVVAGVSPAVVDDLVRLAPLIREKTVVLPNPGPERYTNWPTTPGHRWLEHPGLEVVISVGHLNPRKGHEVAIEAFALVHRSRPRARLIIVGAADNQRYHESLAREVDELGLGDFVEFLHVVDDAVPLISAAEVLVHAATSEAFGLVILEALAVGTPVVATDSPGGASWILDHGRFGVLVPVGAPEVMADAVLGLLASPEKRERLARLGRERASAFSVEAVAARYIETAERLVPTRLA